MTNDAVGFAFISGLLLGFIVAVLFMAKLLSATEKKRIKNGLMEDDGVVYRITRIDP